MVLPIRANHFFSAPRRKTLTFLRASRRHSAQASCSASRSPIFSIRPNLHRLHDLLQPLPPFPSHAPPVALSCRGAQSRKVCLSINPASFIQNYTRTATGFPSFFCSYQVQKKIKNYKKSRFVQIAWGLSTDLRGRNQHSPPSRTLPVSCSRASSS